MPNLRIATAGNGTATARWLMCVLPVVCLLGCGKRPPSEETDPYAVVGAGGMTAAPARPVLEAGEEITSLQAAG